MDEIEEFAQTLGKSRPIFSLQISKYSGSITLNTGAPIYKYEPTFTEGNVIESLIASNHQERFSMHSGQFNVNYKDIVSGTISDIRRSIVKFLEKNLHMKNPRQSKVYRWACRELPNDNDFNTVLVSLYKYMRTFCDADMYSSNQEHAQNTIALLEAMQEKYAK